MFGGAFFSVLFVALFLCPMSQFANANGTISPQHVTLNTSNYLGIAINEGTATPVYSLNFTCIFGSEIFNNGEIVFFRRFEHPDIGMDEISRNAFDRIIQFSSESMRRGQVYQVNFFSGNVPTEGVLGFAARYRCVSDSGEVTPFATVDVLYAPIYNGIQRYPFSDNGRRERRESDDAFALDAVYIKEKPGKDAMIPLVFLGAYPPIEAFYWTVNNNILEVNNNNRKYAANASQLVIYDVSRSDSGVYGVTAVNSAGTSRGSSGVSLTVRFPPEYKNPSNLLYIKRGDPILLNCTPQATSADYGPIFNIEDLNGPPSFTRVSYQWTRNSTLQSIDSPILNITMEAGIEHSGLYTCTASDEVILKRRRSTITVEGSSTEETVLTTSTRFSPLNTTVNFTVMVGDPPSPPDGLGVTYTSTNSLLVSWRGSEVPLGEEQVPLTYTLMLTGEDSTVRSETVQDTGVSGGQYQQSFDNIQSGVYSVSLVAENPFGSSGSISIAELPVEGPGSFYTAFIIVTVGLVVMVMVTIGLVVYICCLKKAGVLASRNMKEMTNKMSPMDSKSYMGLNLQSDPSYMTVPGNKVKKDGSSCESRRHSIHHNDTDTSHHYNIVLEINPSYEGSPTTSVDFIKVVQHQQKQQQQQHGSNGYSEIRCDKNPAYIPLETTNDSPDTSLKQQQQQKQQHKHQQQQHYMNSSSKCEGPIYSIAVRVRGDGESREEPMLKGGAQDGVNEDQGAPYENYDMYI